MGIHADTEPTRLGVGWGAALGVHQTQGIAW